CHRVDRARGAGVTRGGFPDGAAPVDESAVDRPTACEDSRRTVAPVPRLDGCRLPARAVKRAELRLVRDRLDAAVQPGRVDADSPRMWLHGRRDPRQRRPRPGDRPAAPRRAARVGAHTVRRLGRDRAGRHGLPADHGPRSRRVRPDVDVAPPRVHGPRRHLSFPSPEGRPTWAPIRNPPAREKPWLTRPTTPRKTPPLRKAPTSSSRPRRATPASPKRIS